MLGEVNYEKIAQDYLAHLELLNRPANIELVQAIHSQHLAQFSFNNVPVVLAQNMPLDVPTLFEKIVVKGRGGYCFEHNKLMMSVLQGLGFEVRLLLARVVYNTDADKPRTHRMTLLTVNEEQYIVDVGFGRFGARLAVKLELGLEQDLGDACYRIIENAQGNYCYQIYKDGDFFTLYTFDLNTYTESDCLLGHFYSHQHPEAAFVNNLVISIKPSNCIYSLRNDEYTHIQPHETKTIKIHSGQQFHDILQQVFKLDVDAVVAEFLYSRFVKDKAQ
mgnify:CR=1 FL=1